MRRLLLILVLVLAACSSDSVDSTTTTVSSTLPSATAAPTSTTPPLLYELDNCSAPQVTFSPLCEAYELIQDWYVDRPIDPGLLAEAAVEGLVNFETSEQEDPPRTVLCSVPDGVFEGLCSALTLRVEETAIPIGDAIEASLTAMIEKALDPFSYYVPPEQVGNFRANGVVGGVGILLDATDAVGSKCVRVSETCRLQVVFVVEDNPGESAGLMDGDVIVAIDGQSVEGMGFVEAGAFIAGDETGEVTLSVERGSEVIDFSIKRGPLTVPTVEIEVAAPGVGYIRIPDFETDIPGLVYDGLISLQEEPLDTIVVDLRDNPGGFIDSAVDVISEFVDGGVIINEFDGTNTYEYLATEGGLATSEKLIVLVNNGSASAAEVTAAALREVRDATVVGLPTYGKDAVQIAFPLKNGSELYLVVGRWSGPGGTTVGTTGLIPDHEADLPSSLTASELVARALELAG